MTAPGLALLLGAVSFLAGLVVGGTVPIVFGVAAMLVALHEGRAP